MIRVGASVESCGTYGASVMEGLGDSGTEEGSEEAESVAKEGEAVMVRAEERELVG
jgi:hypothetical protein